MSKNLILFLLLVFLFILGLGYAVYSDPELASQRLFKVALKEFSKQSEPLEVQYLSTTQLTPQQHQLIIESSIINELGIKTTSEQPLAIDMVVSKQRVALIFSAGDWPLAEQTIILRPFKKDQQVRWKCIEGTVLMRFRTKDCRLGYGF